MGERSRVVREVTADGTLHSLTLAGPHGNVVDTDMCDSLLAAVAESAAMPDGKLLILSGARGNFSFGASVQEHLPDSAPQMLSNMRRVIEALRGFPYPTLAAVEGRCLGGGLELALACGMVFADRRAVLAFPEIRLGCFAPFGTALLGARVPRVVAEELLLTGRDFSAAEAVSWGLANRVVPPGKMEQTVVGFASEKILPHSAACLRVATKALRSIENWSWEDRLAAMERLYLEELVALEDASEGIHAFLEKRSSRWQNR